MSDLGRRVAVAAVGIPAVLGLVWLGGWFVALPLAAFAGWGAHEMYRFARQKSVDPVGWVGSSMAAGFVLLAGWRNAYLELAPVALALLVVGGLVAALEAMRTRGPTGAPLSATAVTVFGAAYVGLPLSFALLLLAVPETLGLAEGGDRLASLGMVALPLAATWIGDASAYFAGTAWGRGRAKLAPTISPNKSWVGFWANLGGGGAAGALWYVAVRPLMPGLGDFGVTVFVGVGALLGLAAVIGDLLESLYKREAGVKDSGTFFPGHGGVLDRIDSLLFTIPVAWLLLTLMGALR